VARPTPHELGERLAAILRHPAGRGGPFATATPALLTEPNLGAVQEALLALAVECLTSALEERVDGLARELAARDDALLAADVAGSA
jgi:hypothetical protein